jgi:hypothetical protein
MARLTHLGEVVTADEGALDAVGTCWPPGSLQRTRDTAEED